MGYFIQNNWSGGLAESSLTGILGSVAEGVGIDIHSEPGVLKVNNALIIEQSADFKGASGTLTDFPTSAFTASDGNSYWFGKTGRIYKRETNGDWTHLYTSGYSQIYSAQEYNGNIYFASAAVMSRKPFPGASNWSDVQAAFAGLSNQTQHPMVVQAGYLCVANGTTIATVSSGSVFTAAGLPDVSLEGFDNYQVITSLSKFGIDIVAGTENTGKGNSCRLLRWDLASPSFISAENIDETRVNCILPVDDRLFIQAGHEGQFYRYDGVKMERYNRLPVVNQNGLMSVWNESKCTFRGKPLIGISAYENNRENFCNEGIYSLTHNSNAYPIVPMLEYTANSSGSVKQIAVGAMIEQNNKLIVSYMLDWGATQASQSGSIYVSSVATGQAAKGSVAYVKTLQVGGDRITKKTFKEYAITYRTKPANTDIILNYYPNYSSMGTITLNDQSDYNKLYNKSAFEAGVAQFQINFSSSGSASAEVEGLAVKFDEKEIL